MKILIASSYSRSLVNFRGDLIEEMAALGHEVLASGPEEGYEKEIAGLGARFVSVPFERAAAGLGGDLKYFFRLLKLVSHERPRIVFSYTAKPVIYASLAAKISGISRIYPMVTGLGYAFTAGGRRARVLKHALCLLYRLAFASAERVFFQNRDDMNELAALNLIKPEKCVIVNGSGVNMEKFQRAPLPGNASFLMIARLLKSKGVMEFLEAAVKVKLKHPESEFTLAGPMEKSGDSVSREELEPYLKNNAVRYAGPLEDVRPLLAECLAYVLPSYREGTPRTVLEAMATGRPVITTDVPGCRETVKDGVNGFLVPPKDSSALGDKIAWMIENREKLPAMSEAGYKMCAEKFDVKKVNRVLMEAMGLGG